MDIEKTNALKPIGTNILTDVDILSDVDVEKLPQFFSEYIDCVKKAKYEYEIADRKEKEVKSKVGQTLEEADKLIESVKNIGGHSARLKKFLWHEYTSTSDEIEAIKLNLNEIIEHSENSAVAQKMLAEVQSVIFESQTALLNLQKTHFEYQQKIAEATKFVFGLSAYSMATNQSVLIKLKAILSGASEKELGELAQNQLFMALDQIKNQENIIIRMKETEDLIRSLSESIDTKQNEILRISEIYAVQNIQITENTDKISDIEEDVDAIEKNIDDVEENIDELEEDVDAIEAKNEEQDKLLKAHDENIDVIEENVNAIEKNIDDVEENIDELEEDVDAIETKNEEQDKILKAHDENIDEIEENIDAIENSIDNVEGNIKKTEENIEANKSDIQKNLDKINALITEVTSLKELEKEAEKKIAQARIIALVSGGIGVVSLAISVLIALGII